MPRHKALIIGTTDSSAVYYKPYIHVLFKSMHDGCQIKNLYAFTDFPPEYMKKRMMCEKGSYTHLIKHDLVLFYTHVKPKKSDLFPTVDEWIAWVAEEDLNNKKLKHLTKPLLEHVEHLKLILLHKTNERLLYQLHHRKHVTYKNRIKKLRNTQYTIVKKIKSIIHEINVYNKHVLNTTADI